MRIAARGWRIINDAAAGDPMRQLLQCRSSLARAGIVVLVAAMAAGCSPAALVTPLPPAVAACAPDSAGQPIPLPPMSPVVAIEHGNRGVLLLDAAHPDDPSLAYLSICRFDRGPTVQSTDRTISILDAVAGEPLTVDATATFGSPTPEGAPAASEGVMAGRFSGPVATVVIDLSDGSSLEASIADGYWLAWWQGALDDAVTVRGLDGDGRVVMEVSVPGG